MNWSKAVITGINKQGIKSGLDEIPVNIYLNMGDILRCCFLDEETDDLLIVSETTNTGTEEVRVVNKVDVSYISVVYGNIIPEKVKSQDKMFQ